jgi:hypothetical protein
VDFKICSASVVLCFLFKGKLSNVYFKREFFSVDYTFVLLSTQQGRF